MNTIAQLKKKMLTQEAVAEDFKNTIEENGWTMEIIGLLCAYYELEDEIKEAKAKYSDALMFVAQRKAEGAQ